MSKSSTKAASSTSVLIQSPPANLTAPSRLSSGFKSKRKLLRDPKGLYKKARSGELKNFTGIDSAYEIPENADLVLDTKTNNAEELADQIINFLESKKII